MKTERSDAPTPPAQTRPIRVRRYFCPRLKRLIVCAADPDSAKRLRKICEIAQTRLRHLIHPNVFGATRGSSQHTVISKAFAASSAGMWIVLIDLKQAFPSVSMTKLRKILKPHASSSLLNELCTHEDHGLYEPPLVDVPGLPQGLSVSPLLFGIYVSSQLAVLLKGHEFGLYVDDGFGWFRTEADAKTFLKVLRATCARRRVPLHTWGEKKPRIVAPGEQFSILGVTISNGGVFAERSAAYAVDVIQSIVQDLGPTLQPGSLLRDAVPATILPCTKTRGETSIPGDRLPREQPSPQDPSRTRPADPFLTPWRRGAPCYLAERTHAAAKLIDEFAECPRTGSLWATAMKVPPIPLLRLREREQAGIEHWPVITTFTPAQRQVRRFQQYQLTEQERIEGLFHLHWNYQMALNRAVTAAGAYDIRSAKVGAGIGRPNYEKLSRRALNKLLLVGEQTDPRDRLCILARSREDYFLAFLKELWALLIFFSDCDTLTGTFYGWNGRLPRRAGGALQIFLHNELRIINHSRVFDDLLRRIARPELTADKMRQYLRGFATWRGAELWRGRRLPMREWMMKEIGTLTWPFWNLHELSMLIARIHTGKVEPEKFRKRIESMQKGG